MNEHNNNLNPQDDDQTLPHGPMVFKDGSHIPDLVVEEDVDETQASTTIHIEEPSEAKGAQSVPVGRKLSVRTVFVSLLVVLVLSASTYTVGYYRGQIGIEDEALLNRVDKLIGDVKAENINQSVVAYLQENPDAFDVSPLGFSTVYEGIKSSVVGITKETTYRDWFNVQKTTGGSGSGVIIKDEGDVLYIVTNQHVVDKADKLVVEIADGVVVDAKIVGVDTPSDLAVVSISKADIPKDLVDTLNPIAVGDSDAVKVGDPAVALGNPLGFNNTLTAGFVSATGRSIKSDQSSTYIQTDAAINPGNSGGALVNSKGELIGINTAKIANERVEGVGFAIPSNIMMPIVEEIIENGSVSRPFIGIVGTDVSTQDSALYDIPMGVMIVEVYEGSPAQKAGLQRSDLIVGIDGKKVFGMNDVTDHIKDMKPGDTIELDVVQKGETRVQVKVVLGNSNS